MQNIGKVVFDQNDIGSINGDIGAGTNDNTDAQRLGASLIPSPAIWLLWYIDLRYAVVCDGQANTSIGISSP